jgi:hypothetical protein
VLFGFNMLVLNCLTFQSAAKPNARSVCQRGVQSRPGGLAKQKKGLANVAIASPHMLPPMRVIVCATR